MQDSLDKDKALDMAVIPMAGKTAIADYMIVASGTSKRHVGAMAGHIVEAVDSLGATICRRRGCHPL